MTAARDIVTATDVAIEDAVPAGLTDVFDAPVIGEERGGEATAARYWIVDPICGTRTFGSGVPLYWTNRALVEDEHVTIAAIGDPSTGDVLVAEENRGACALNDGTPRPVSTSAESRTLVIEDSHATARHAGRPPRSVADAILADRWDRRRGATTEPVTAKAEANVDAKVQPTEC